MTAGRVTVNGKVVTELGSKVDPLVDEVAVDGAVVRLADGPVTIMLHKPAGFVTTMSDPQGRRTVAELVPTERYPGLFPIGRLDFDTTGLLLFSTDGELGNGLLHPKHHVTKRYLACVEGRPTERDLALPRRSIVRLGIREGRKRQVKRMLAAVGHPVLALHRDSFGPLELGDLPRGSWRALDAEEVAALHQAIGRAE